ncbi:DNA-binding protein [Sphingopyxis sp. Geo48]|uniref:DNA-binding protein n=1 Tax=Sphingopyxis sp. Geo48 TaxID=545241 RepID=UPI0024B667B1|nr:DNA-binding protein [Sphingopyxis sp. Geo48]
MDNESAIGVERVNVRLFPDNRITRADWAKMVNRTTKTVTMWASKGWGPQPISVGGRIFHNFAECQAMARGEVPIKPLARAA